MLRAALLLLCLSYFASAADLTGKWVGRSQLPADRQNGMPSAVFYGVILELAQNGNEVTGTYKDPHEPLARLQFGRVENDKLILWFHNYRNVLLTGEFTLRDGWLTGRLTTSSGDLLRVALKKNAE